MKSGKIVFPDEFQQLQRSRGTFDDEETYSDADADADAADERSSVPKFAFLGSKVGGSKFHRSF